MAAAASVLGTGDTTCLPKSRGQQFRQHVRLLGANGSGNHDRNHRKVDGHDWDGVDFSGSDERESFTTSMMAETATTEGRDIALNGSEIVRVARGATPPEGGDGGGDPAKQPEIAVGNPVSVATEDVPVSEETKKDHDRRQFGRAQSSDDGGADGGGFDATCGAEKKLGFLGGTAQLALFPGAMFSRALHPALAAPSLPVLDVGVNPLSWIRKASTRGKTGPGYAVAAENYETVTGLGYDDSDSDGKNIGDEKVTIAAATEEVAAVLPPTMVLETCLLAPLQKYCRLASSSCLDVFMNELGVIRLAGACFFGPCAFFYVAALGLSLEVDQRLVLLRVP